MKYALLLCALISSASAQKWTIQYFYDEAKTELEIFELSFPNAQRGIAIGAIYDNAGRTQPKPVALATSDGGAHWKTVPLKEAPRSIYFLNDSQGWMVTDGGLWSTEESGLTWKKIGPQIKPDKELYKAKNLSPPSGLLIRVWFLDPMHGFGVGLQKTIVETKDGGRTWMPVAEAEKPSADPTHSAYTHIWFADSKKGVIVGGSQPPRRDLSSALPPWMDPERAAKRRQVPTLTLMVQTMDGGTTWESQTTPLFGSVSSVKFITDGKTADGLIVFGYNESFEWPSDVYRLTKGATGRVFRDKTPRVTDAALFPGPHVVLAGAEPTGKMNTVPVPGRVRILESGDYKTWTEMPVDYKAEARSVMLAGPDADHLWAATDTGMILKWTPNAVSKQ